MIQSQALSILKTGANVFLTGERGSGKTYIINEYVAYLRRRGIEPAITASTGIAATHIGGTTIHSWSGVGIKTDLDKNNLKKILSSRYIVKRVSQAKVPLGQDHWHHLESRKIERHSAPSNAPKLFSHRAYENALTICL